MDRASWTVAVAAALLVGTTGCGQQTAADTAGTPDTPAASPSPSASATEGAARRGTVEVDGAELAYWCQGQGAPVVLLEAGSDSAGTSEFSEMVPQIADVTTVCTYNRLGTGTGSDIAPKRARTSTDLAETLDGVATALQLEPPYVVSGQSGGGNVVIAYAQAHPAKVAALVPIEGYFDDPAEIAAWQADEGFTWEDNPEHVDVVAAAELQAAYAMPFGDFPVLVISASSADPGGPENQAHWLAISPRSSQVVVDGPHDLPMSAPDELAALIVGVVENVRAGE